MIEIELSDGLDLERVGEVWRELEGRADGSFFQSWAWVGCLAAERFSDPVLLHASDGGRTVGLGLFNRRRRFGRTTLWLNESGTPRHDATFVEHNGLLVERDCPATLVGDCLNALSERGRPRVILSGAPDLYVAAARASVLRASRPAPYVDLAAVRRAGRNYLDHLSANTRYQLRRSHRRFAACGPLTISRAETAAEALQYLDGLAALHQDYWTRRGRPGAFANPDFTRFHRALIAGAIPEGGVDLLLVAAGGRAVGYLYNFRYRRTVYAYQSGFDYGAADNARKPGLTSHHLAVERYLALGADRYDFLAGGDRYKMSLSTGATMLNWLELGGGPISALRRRLPAIDALRRWRDSSASRSGQIG